jgi:Mn2+/Fe2+ NRAMP family transporter
MALLKTLGPGLVAGASDIDPTTVATLAVIGSTTGYGLAWLVVLVIPMLAVVQVISATIGVVTREGLEDVIRVCYGRTWALFTLLLIVLVNLVTLAADLEGGGAALSLLTGIPYQWFVVPLAVGVAALLIWGSYASLERVLRYVLLLFLAYIVSAFLARPDWGQVIESTLIPHFTWSSDYVAGALAIFGTTLTSYAYVWESISTAEEKPPLKRLGLLQLDAGLGMVAAGIVFYFIVICTGATLGVHHRPVQTAQDAAAALAPLAGQFSSVIFGVGLLASAIIAIPVLAGTSAYVMAEAFGWRASLDDKFARAPQFYMTMLLSLAIAAAVTIIGVNPIQLLFFSSIVGGFATPVTLVLMMLVARNKRVMGGKSMGGLLLWGGWLVTALVTVACIIYLVQTFLP